LLALVVTFYVFIVSAGRWVDWPTWSSIVDSQAEGFRAGHLYAVLPPGTNHWDYSPYKDHWYTYWGLFPAMALAAVKALLRRHEAVGDQRPVFVFVVGRAIAGALLIGALARRLRPAPPAFAVALAFLLFALASPIPFLLARAGVYEAAIAGGSCFLTLGIWLAFEGMFAARPAADRWLAAASLVFGLAGGSRSSLLPLVAVATALTIFARWRLDGGTRRRLVGLCLVAGAPVSLLTAFQLLLNKLRFDEWLEFGVHHQNGFLIKMGRRFVPANLFLYLFQRMDFTCRFPYALAAWNRSRAMAPSWISFQPDYRATEPTVGLLVACPILWFGLAGLALALWRRRRGGGEASPDRVPWRWLGAVLAAGVVVGALPVLYMFSVSMRYEADFASCLLVLALLGAWWLLTAVRSRTGKIALGTLAVTLSVWTIALGVLPGFVGYFNHFRTNNPHLMARMERALDACPAVRNSAGTRSAR
jgi:hypothetical protein